MEKKKFHIEKNTTQETLIIPLFARKLCTELYSSIFSDPAAVELIDRLDYDFSAMEKESGSLMNRFGALEIAMRQTDLQIEIREYLRDHPGAAVVNMGCGLDFTGEACDNGRCRIYNLDMPEIIDIRNQLIPPGERVENISCDINDFSWFDRIDSSEGAVFFAAGVFYYFQITEMQKLINSMALRFPGGKIVFDTAGKAALKVMLRTFVKKAGIDSIGAYFHVGSIEKDVIPWLRNAKVSYKGYMFGYNDLKDPCIPALFRTIARIGDNRMKMKILRIDFDR